MYSDSITVNITYSMHTYCILRYTNGDKSKAKFREIPTETERLSILFLFKQKPIKSKYIN